MMQSRVRVGRASSMNIRRTLILERTSANEGLRIRGLLHPWAVHNTPRAGVRLGGRTADFTIDYAVGPTITDIHDPVRELTAPAHSPGIRRYGCREAKEESPARATSTSGGHSKSGAPCRSPLHRHGPAPCRRHRNDRQPGREREKGGAPYQPPSAIPRLGTDKSVRPARTTALEG